MSTATTAALAESAAPLDCLLVDAALGPVRRFVPDMSTAKWAVSLARKPGTTARRLGDLGAEVGRVLSGTSTVAPQRRDRRFTDTAWTENPLLRRLVQLYLAGEPHRRAAGDRTPTSSRATASACSSSWRTSPRRSPPATSRW